MAWKSCIIRLSVSTSWHMTVFTGFKPDRGGMSNGVALVLQYMVIALAKCYSLTKAHFARSLIEVKLLFLWFTILQFSLSFWGGSERRDIVKCSTPGGGAIWCFEGSSVSKIDSGLWSWQWGNREMAKLWNLCLVLPQLRPTPRRPLTRVIIWVEDHRSSPRTHS